MLYLFRAIVYGTYLLKKRFHGRRDPFKLIPLIQSMTACLNSANETFQMNGARLLEDAFNPFLPRQAKTIPFIILFYLTPDDLKPLRGKGLTGHICPSFSQLTPIYHLPSLVSMPLFSKFGQVIWNYESARKCIIASKLPQN